MLRHVDDIGPNDYYVARGRSAYDIIRELTGTKSVSRLHEYAATFSHSTNVLARYFSLASGGDGETWEFHRYSAELRRWPGHDGWGLNTYVRTSPDLRSLIFFAHGFRQPYDVAAVWARKFLNNQSGSAAEGIVEASGARLRPFAEAGMSPEETFALLYHGLPTGFKRFKGEGELKGRLGQTKKYIEMFRQGLAVEYIMAVGV